MRSPSTFDPRPPSRDLYPSEAEEVLVNTVLGVAFAVVLVLLGVFGSGCADATSLTPLDARAIENQQRAALAIVAHAGDAGAIESLAESVYCGAGGVLRRAGEASLDAGVPCP